MAKKPDTSSRIAENKKAAYNYFFEERYEAGMVLEGWEVKALREGKVQLTDGYVLIKGGELFLIGCQINPLRTASTHVRADAARTKKLLLHKDEIKRLIGKVEQKGYTLVPLNLHWKNGRVKCEIRARQGQGRARQARHHQGARGQARSRARAQEPPALNRCAPKPAACPSVPRGAHYRYRSC